MTDCQEHICSDDKDQKAMEAVMSQSGVRAGPTQPTTKLPRAEGPINRVQLGQATWPILHRLSLSYPDEPSAEQQQRMTSFIHAFSWMFPCSHCATDFRMTIQESPPRVESRKELALWFCEQHNMVNRKLGKKEWPCTIRRLELTYGRVSHRL